MLNLKTKRKIEWTNIYIKPRWVLQTKENARDYSAYDIFILEKEAEWIYVWDVHLWSLLENIKRRPYGSEDVLIPDTQIKTHGCHYFVKIMEL